MADFNEETIRELNESIRELTGVMQTAMGITGSAANSQKTMAKNTAEAATATANLSGRNKEAAQRAQETAAANKKAAEAAHILGESFGKLGTAISEGTKSVITFGKAMTDTREGVAKYNTALNQASGALSVGLGAFGKIGKVLDLLLKPLTALIETSLDYNDRIFEAKDELAKFGATGRITAKEIAEMGAKAGYSSAELGKYVKIVGSAGAGLVNLGGTVNDGVVEFAKLTNVTKEERMRLRMMGVTMDEFNQNTADYIKMQTLSGVRISDEMKKSGFLQKATKEYTDNLILLSNLTGQSTEELKKKEQAALQEREVMIANIATSREIEKLRKEGNTKEANALEQEMMMRNKLIQEATKEQGEEVGKALAHYLATGVFTESTTKIMDNTAYSMEGLLAALKQGVDVSKKWNEGQREAMLGNLERGKLAIQLDDQYGKSKGINTESLKLMTTLMNANTEQGKADLQAKKLAADAEETARVERLESERQTRLNMDIMASTISNGIMPAIDKMTKGIEKLTDMLTDPKFWDEIKKKFDEFMGYLKVAGIALAGIAATSVAGKMGGMADAAGGLLKGGAKNLLKIAGKGNLLGMAAGLGGEYLANKLGRETTGGKLAGTAARAAQGAAMGAFLGPLGALAGGTIGAAWGAYDNFIAPKEEEKPQPAAASTVAPAGSVQTLLDKIASVESRGDYNIMVDNKRPKDFGITKNLTEMTIGEVLALQDKMGQRNASGKYQIQRDTLVAQLPRAGLGTGDLYNSENQEKLGLALLRHRGLDSYLGKKMDADTFANQLAMEWAALPMPSGQSYYEGRGGNKSLMSREEFMKALPKARLGGAFSGPNSGYPVMLHGMETVVPTPNPNTTLLKVEGDSAADKITSAMSGMNGDALQGIMQELYSMMEDKLSEMVDKLSTSNDLQDKLLKVQM